MTAIRNLFHKGESRPIRYKEKEPLRVYHTSQSSKNRAPGLATMTPFWTMFGNGRNQPA